MSNKVKHINIKNHTYYYCDDIINIKDFDPNNIKIDEKSYKNIPIYYTAYVTIKDSKHVKINSVNPLDLMLNKINGYFEEFNGNNYITLVSTNKSKKMIKKFDLDNKFPLNKAIEIPVMIIVAKAIFCENNKYYKQVFFR